MKKVSISVFGTLAIVVAVASAFTTSKKITTYELFSVQQDQVATSSATTVSAYNSKLRTDLVAAYSAPIASTEDINTWITSRPAPNDDLTAFVDVSDNDQVGLVKFEKVNGVRTSVQEHIDGDSQQ